LKNSVISFTSKEYFLIKQEANISSLMWADLKLNPDDFFPRTVFNLLTGGYIPEV